MNYLLAVISFISFIGNVSGAPAEDRYSPTAAPYVSVTTISTFYPAPTSNHAQHITLTRRLIKDEECTDQDARLWEKARSREVKKLKSEARHFQANVDALKDMGYFDIFVTLKLLRNATLLSYDAVGPNPSIEAMNAAHGFARYFRSAYPEMVEVIKNEADSDVFLWFFNSNAATRRTKIRIAKVLAMELFDSITVGTHQRVNWRKNKG